MFTGGEDVILTDSIQHPLGFALPPHTDEVDGNSGGDDAETDRTLHWSLPEGDDDEEEAGEHETHRQQNIYLQGEEREEMSDSSPI